jgi:hypothetical protein
MRGNSQSAKERVALPIHGLQPMDLVVFKSLKANNILVYRFQPRSKNPQQSALFVF